MLAGLTGCGDGEDQDNGVDDGEEMDDVDDKSLLLSTLAVYLFVPELKIYSF